MSPRVSKVLVFHSIRTFEAPATMPPMPSKITQMEVVKPAIGCSLSRVKPYLDIIIAHAAIVLPVVIVPKTAWISWWYFQRVFPYLLEMI